MSDTEPGLTLFGVRRMMEGVVPPTLCTASPDGMPSVNYLSLAEYVEAAAEFLGVSIAMLERDRSVGERRIPCVRIGKAVRYDRRVLEQRIAEGEFAIPAPDKRRSPRRRNP